MFGPIVLMVDLLLLGSTLANGQNTDVSPLHEKIVSLANEKLGVQQYQDYVNTVLSYTIDQTDSSVLVAQIASALSTRLQTHTSFVVKLKSEIEQALSSPASLLFSNCGSFNGGSYDASFRTQIDRKSMCVEGLSQQSMPFYQSVLDQMMYNLNAEPTLRWQYFTSEAGFRYRYPAVPRSASSSVYDPRLRPWYRTTISPNPKSVVIVIQRSTSMSSRFGSSQTMLEAAKSAATTILTALNLQDLVAVSAFSSTVSFDTSDPCYRNQLAEPNPTTLQNLKNFISNLQPDGNANYVQAFVSAFQLLNASQTAKSDRAIIVLTNGDNLSGALSGIKDAILNGNRLFGNKVAIYVYSLSADSSVINLLSQITQQSFADRSVGEPKSTDPVILTGSTSLNNWRSQMANYFASSIFPANLTVVHTVPFYDAINTDLSISLCLPVQKNGLLNGSVCVDVTINELFSEVHNFQQSTSAYVFLMDDLGSLLIHPLLPVPVSAAVDTTPVSLSLAERDSSGKIQLLQQNMITNISGSMKIVSRQVYPRGQSKLAGVDTSNLHRTYTWRQVSNTNLIACLVITDGFVNISIAGKSLGSSYDPVLLLDEVLFDQYTPDLCNLDGKAVQIFTKSAVRLAPQCFKDPQRFLDQPVTASLYKSWKDFLEGRVSTSPDIKSNIPDAVRSTYMLESIWLNNTPGLLLGRYIGLREGIFRRFPGELFPKAYDPSTRPWYRQAVANPSIYAIYGPFQHASINVCIVSIAKAITKQTRLLNSTTTIGVMAASLKLNFFNQLINENVQSCSRAHERCFVVDQSGFVVIHWSFSQQTGDCANITDQHITCMEGAIAQDMIKRGKLVRSRCASYNNKNNIYFYKIVLQDGVYTGDFYDIYAVPETNVYVVQVHTLYLLPPYACNCIAQSKADSSQGTCSESSAANVCEYPCYSETRYSQLCYGQLNYGDEDYPCIPSPPVWTEPPINLTRYLASLCYCDSNCSTASTSASDHNLLLLLVLLALLLLVPAVVLTVYCVKKHREDPNVTKMTESVIYAPSFEHPDVLKSVREPPYTHILTSKRPFDPVANKGDASFGGGHGDGSLPAVENVSHGHYNPIYDTLKASAVSDVPSSSGSETVNGSKVEDRQENFKEDIPSEDIYLTVTDLIAKGGLDSQQPVPGASHEAGVCSEIPPPHAHLNSAMHRHCNSIDGEIANVGEKRGCVATSSSKTEADQGEVQSQRMDSALDAVTSASGEKPLAYV